MSGFLFELLACPHSVLSPVNVQRDDLIITDVIKRFEECLNVSVSELNVFNIRARGACLDVQFWGFAHHHIGCCFFHTGGVFCHVGHTVRHLSNHLSIIEGVF